MSTAEMPDMSKMMKEGDSHTTQPESQESKPDAPGVLGFFGGIIENILGIIPGGDRLAKALFD